MTLKPAAPQHLPLYPCFFDLFPSAATSKAKVSSILSRLISTQWISDQRLVCSPPWARAPTAGWRQQYIQIWIYSQWGGCCGRPHWILSWWASGESGRFCMICRGIGSAAADDLGLGIRSDYTEINILLLMISCIYLDLNIEPSVFNLEYLMS